MMETIPPLRQWNAPDDLTVSQVLSKELEEVAEFLTGLVIS